MLASVTEDKSLVLDATLNDAAKSEPFQTKKGNLMKWAANVAKIYTS